MSIAYPHVTSDPAVCEGRPCISTTGIKVTDLALAQAEGHKIADLLVRFGGRPLTLAEVFAGLAYFHDNREELEAIAETDRRTAETADQDRQAALMRRIMGQA